MRKRQADNGTPGVPPGLPDRFLNPVIELDPDHDTGNREYAAFQSFRAYARGLEAWLNDNAPGYRAPDVMTALGATLTHFRAVARELPVR